MNYSEWRRQQKRPTLTLPSGLDVKVRRVSLLGLAMNGDIPQTLQPFADDLLEKGARLKLSTTDLAHFGELVNVVVCACVVEPRVVLEGESTDEHLLIKDMEPDDRIFIFNWSNQTDAAGAGGPRALQKFPKQSKRAVAAVQRRNGVHGAPK